MTAAVQGGVYCPILERVNKIKIPSSSLSDKERNSQLPQLTTKSNYQWQCSSKDDHHEYRPAFANTEVNTTLIEEKLTEMHKKKVEHRRSSLQKQQQQQNKEKDEDEVKAEEEAKTDDLVSEDSFDMERFCKKIAMRMSLKHPPTDSIFASNHVYVNRARLARKTLPLHRVSALDGIALEHAKVMESQGKCFHSDASNLISKFFELSSPFRRIGENVCCGNSLDSIHNEMMKNPNLKGDKNNILDRRFSSFGVGVAISSSNEDGKERKLYICQIFVG